MHCWFTSSSSSFLFLEFLNSQLIHRSAMGPFLLLDALSFVHSQQNVFINFICSQNALEILQQPGSTCQELTAVGANTAHAGFRDAKRDRLGRGRVDGSDGKLEREGIRYGRLTRAQKLTGWPA